MRSPSTPQFCCARPAFSLVEATLASAIVAVLLVAALQAAGTSGVAQYKCAERTTARLLADGLMAEILPLNYQDPAGQLVPGREAGETLDSKSNYDDIDDFDGWSESPPQDSNGHDLPDLTGWRRTVRVEWVDPVNPNAELLSETGAKRITVTVMHNNVAITTRIAIRTQVTDASTR